MTDEQINECGCYKCCEHVKKPMNPYGLEKDACQLSDGVLLLEEVVKCPKKNKYRIGDKVKVVSHESHNGKVGEITRIKDGKEKPYGVYFGGDFPLYFSESELESDFKLDRKRGGAMFRVGDKAESKYKSGDKVKIPCMDRCGELIGIENNGRWRILLDDGTFAFVFESEFKPVENTDQLNPKFDELDETLSAEEIDKCIEDCADEFATIVHKGERYNPSKVDGIIKSFTEQIRVAYERGYKDGNFDGQTYAYNKGYTDGMSEQRKEDSTFNTYLRGYNDAIDEFMKHAREMSGQVVKNDE